MPWGPWCRAVSLVPVPCPCPLSHLPQCLALGQGSQNGAVACVWLRTSAPKTLRAPTGRAFRRSPGWLCRRQVAGGRGGTTRGWGRKRRKRRRWRGVGSRVWAVLRALTPPAPAERRPPQPEPAQVLRARGERQGSRLDRRRARVPKAKATKDDGVGAGLGVPPRCRAGMPWGRGCSDGHGSALCLLQESDFSQKHDFRTRLRST